MLSRAFELRVTKLLTAGFGRFFVQLLPATMRIKTKLSKLKQKQVIAVTLYKKNQGQ
jgi:hypothetical protein